MNGPESYSHAFFVRVWLEETAEEAGRATWRGSITHLPEGQHRYFFDLDAIVSVVARYLREMGIDT